MNYIYKKWWAQVTMWLFILAVLFSLNNYFQSYTFAIIAASFTTATLFIVHLLSVKVLIPIYKKDPKRYFLFSSLVLIVLTLIFSAIEVSLIDRYRVFDHDPPPIVFHYFRQMLMLSFVFFVDITINLMEHTTQLKESEKILTEEKLETELKLLKAQINPHFIFNALNNIYSLTYMQSSKAPESVLKLSEMLRYVFYDCSKDRVALSGEINYIENFTAFQKMKSESPQDIILNNKLSNSALEVAPMLLIPFIENAFKYSRIEEDENSRVVITIDQKDKLLNFTIRNSVPTGNKALAGSGMGIKNVQHRLNIIYPQQHQLEINDKGAEFEVQLTLHVS